MSEQQIVPDRITKPIQLLAAWLTGLVLVNGSFLAASSALSEPQWLRAVLVIASIINVPLFLGCLFLLQTRFRPEMQEDSFYSKYLELNTGKVISTSPVDASLQQLRVEIAHSNERYVEMVSGIDVGLKALAMQMSQKSDAAESSNQLSFIAKEVTKSVKLLEKAKSEAEDASVEVVANDLLPEFENLKADLTELQIRIDRTFGSSSKDPEVPKQRIVGFGRGVPMEKLRQVVGVCLRYGFDLLHFTNREENANNIYIGSYIYRAPQEPQPVPLDRTMLDLLNAPSTSLREVIAAVQRTRA